MKIRKLSNSTLVVLTASWQLCEIIKGLQFNIPHFKQEMNGAGITSTWNLHIFKIISWLFIGLLDYTIIYCR
jgi:hypothetical protein